MFGRDGAKRDRANAQDGQNRNTVAPVLMHPANAALLQYWHLVRGTAGIAAWSDFDLLEITGYLPNVMLLEWTPGDQLICRFAGLQIVSWLGQDPTNVNLKSLGGIAQCKAMVPTLSSRAIALLKVAYETRAGGRAYMEDLCLPLNEPGRPVSHVLIGSQLLEGGPVAEGEQDTIRPDSFRLLGRVRLPLDRVDRGGPLIYALAAGRPESSKMQ